MTEKDGRFETVRKELFAAHQQVMQYLGSYASEETFQKFPAHEALASIQAELTETRKDLEEARGLLEGIVPRMYGARITSAGPTTSWDLTTSGPHLNAIIDFLERTENP